MATVMTSDAMARYMLDRPASVFPVFTHVDGQWWSADGLIRRALAIRYGQQMDVMPSHCGSIWAEDGELWYWHQTWPVFSRDRWRPRRYNRLFEVAAPAMVYQARDVCRREYLAGRGYGIGKLLNFGYTLWSYATGNVIRVGEVCSTSMALQYPGIVIDAGRPVVLEHHDFDPWKVVKRMRYAGLREFIVDRRL